jgi:16S rRNA (adenine1518-N6/adenine1519-N6)-dimethyltransferase
MENPYLDPSRVRAALRALDLRPTRGMGQNFLTDPAALNAIVSAAELTTDDTVVEVGPGLGVLTWELLRRVGRVVAVELDKRLAARLHEEFASPRLNVVQADILNVAPGQLLGDDRRPTTDDRLAISETRDTRQETEDRRLENSKLKRPEGTRNSKLIPLPSYKVVANLPYAITSAALRHFLEAEHKPSMMVVLIQWEVAQRITARPGDLSVLAHSVQLYAEPEIVERVPARSFFPEPAVDSAVLRLRLRPRPAVDVDDVNQLMRVIKSGFLHARKKLSNALPSGLASIGVRLEKEQVIAALEDAGVDPGRRAETLTLEEWAAVYRNLGAMAR